MLLGEIPDDCWLVLLTRSRDSDCLTESNWTVALDRLGGEGDDVQIDRFGHWACGWWEALSVRKGSEAEKVAEEMEEALADYPVLDDQHFSELETEEADRIWESCYSPKERIEYIREHPIEFEFSGFADMIGCVRGKWFGGYASDLIG